MEELVQQAITAFAAILHPAQYEPGELLHRAGETSQTVFLVKKGALRSFYYQDGRDITAHFALDHHIIGAIDSLVKGKPSRYQIEALEPSQVLRLDYGEMEAYLEANPRLERLARQISQALYLDLVERLEDMTFLSAKARYDHLLARYPTLLQRVNLGHIASYLGITQETLSRVRSMG